MLQSIGKKKNYTVYILIFLFLSTINNLSLIKNKKLLSNITNIEVIGLTETLNLNIKKNFGFLINNNIFQINKKYIKNELDRYNYLQNYKVFKLYPSKIIISLTQTNFLGSTIKNNKKFIIGSNGKLISHEMFNFSYDLPNVFGTFSSEDFTFFTKLINQSGFDYNNIKDIFFFPSGRWDIRTKDNITIKLSKEDTEYALKKAQNIINNKELKNNNVIDLRMTNQVIIFND